MIQEITFEQAKNHRIGFHKKYAGMKIEEVARFNDGLRYLMFVVRMPWLNETAREHIKVYLSDSKVREQIRGMGP